MSDYLVSLVSRETGLAAAVVPRLPSRFEPEAPGLQAVPQPEHEIEQEESAEAAAAPRQARPAGMHRMAAVAPPAPPAPLAAQAVAPATSPRRDQEAAPAATERKPVAPDLPAPAEMAPKAVRSKHVAPLARHPVAPAPATGDAPPARLQTVPVAQSLHVTPPASPSSPAQPAPRRMAKAVVPAFPTAPAVAARTAGVVNAAAQPPARRDLPQPIVAPAAPASPTRRELVALAPGPRASLRPAAQLMVHSEERARPEPDSTPPQSVIHVSIGRVEIRAVNAPPAPARSQAKTASLSLEQFLAQQKERGMR